MTAGLYNPLATKGQLYILIRITSLIRSMKVFRMQIGMLC